MSQQYPPNPNQPPPGYGPPQGAPYQGQPQPPQQQHQQPHQHQPQPPQGYPGAYGQAPKPSNLNIWSLITWGIGGLLALVGLILFVATKDSYSFWASLGQQVFGSGLVVLGIAAASEGIQAAIKSLKKD